MEVNCFRVSSICLGNLRLGFEGCFADMVVAKGVRITIDFKVVKTAKDIDSKLREATTNK
jgi:hypothetical protein